MIRFTKLALVTLFTSLSLTACLTEEELLEEDLGIVIDEDEFADEDAGRPERNLPCVVVGDCIRTRSLVSFSVPLFHGFGDRCSHELMRILFGDPRATSVDS